MGHFLPPTPYEQSPHECSVCTKMYWECFRGSILDRLC